MFLACCVLLLSSSAALAQTAPTQAPPVQTPQATSPQSAEEIELPSFEQQALELATTLAKRGLRRFRRSWTFGPTFGLLGGYSNDSDTALGFSAGLSIYKFDIPLIPSPSDLKSLLVDRARQELTARLKARVLRGEPVEPLVVEELAREVWRDVVDLFLLGHRPKTFEKPGLAGRVLVERFDDTWAGTLLISYGIGPVYLGLGTGIAWESQIVPRGQLELSLPLVLSSSLRTPVAELHLGINTPFTDRDVFPTYLTGGLRLSLDII